MNAAAQTEQKKLPWNRRLAFIALVLAAQVGLIFIFGERRPVAPRLVTNVPTLRLAGDAGELLALNDPTLFALPHREGFAGPAWLEPPHVEFHRKEWTEPSRWLAFSSKNPETTFAQSLRANRPAPVQVELKPPPKFAEPLAPIESALAQISTVQIAGDLAQRPLLDKMNLPSLPYNDLIAPSKVQVVVDAAGNVVSAVLLPPENTPDEAAVQNADADQRALELARGVRFAPSSGMTFGQVIFNWRTVPPPATNTSVNP